MKQRRNKGRRIDGILLLDKPGGITSNDALQSIKRLFDARKAGHTGSLDPLATGMLPICLGEATKFSRFLLEADKRYQVTAKLGVKTETGDAEGSVVQEREVKIESTAQLESVLDGFRGAISQVPSMYSALKYQGQPLYKLARQGIEVPREARAVEVYSMVLEEQKDDLLHLSIHCSKGTYVRTLIEDIGEMLGCGGHVIALRRLSVGPYLADQMIDMPMLKSMRATAGLSMLDARLLGVDSMVSGWPEVTLSEAAAFYLRQGQAVIIPYAPAEGWVRLMSKEDQFMGVGEVQSDGKIAPRRLVK